MKSSIYKNKISKLTELLNIEHGDCDDTTCAIAVCMENEYNLWAISLFSSTGASSEEFDKIYNSLPRDQFDIEAEAERAEFVESIPSVSCPHCNAVVYNPEECDYYCSNCAKTALFKVKLNCATTDGVVSSGQSTWIDGFNVVKEKEVDGKAIYSIAMKYGKDKSDFSKSILEQSIGSEIPPKTKMEFID
jgi:hypothetical protein